MNLIIKWILFALLIIAIAWIVPGIEITGFLSALIAVIIISFVNAFIKPILQFISLPINFLTLGLFSLIINALMLLLSAKLSPGFEIEGFWSGFFGAILLSIFAPLISKIDEKTE